MIKCPFCGSDKLEKHNEPAHSKTIHKGLPTWFLDTDWFYYVCRDCFENSRKDFKIDFVFTVISGRYFLYIGEQKQWVLKGMLREVVEFT
jgi:hypothetical protein